MKIKLPIICLFFSVSAHSLPAAEFDVGIKDASSVIAMSDGRKKVIFNALVTLQDGGYGKSQSEEIIKSRYGVSSAQLQNILMEGYQKDWLSEKDGY
ncbi:hypothetical protein [Oceanisphaera sp. IT1-181]|uniref:hypothetical protein n=1 Tax=Oceanisphaera sp. IT1-181 TaxID=3081199 RepID=UPI0029C9ED0A|nr:hypothetical protein [Oceanisphaera sp. IT1-181]